MDQQKVFIDTIESLKELAMSNNYVLSEKDIDNAFEGMNINDKQKEVIYSYMKANKITVEGYDGDEGIFQEKEEELVVEGVDEEEDKFLKMYTDELDELDKVSQDEMYQLYLKINDDENAKKQLVEANLKNVIKWIQPFEGKGVSMSDIIGEANLSLMIVMEDLKTEKIESSQQLIEFIKDEVIEYVTIYINDQDEANSVNNMTLDKVNEINDCAIRLSAKLGRNATIDEVAKEMKVEVQEVENIIKISSNMIKNIDYKL